MKTYTYTYVKTRVEAIVDQVDMFLQYAGIPECRRTEVLKGVENRWLSHIGVYLVRNGKRFLEAEISIDWDLHSSLMKITPTVRTDSPGWEAGTAPEVRTIGARFGKRAQDLNILPRCWVRFTKDIRDNPVRHRELCPIVGVIYNGRVEEWEAAPDERSYDVVDLQEVRTTLRSSER